MLPLKTLLTFAHQFIPGMISKALTFFLVFLISASVVSQEKRIATPSGQITAKGAADREELVAYAKKFLGTPYRKSGTEPKKGFDCSGFVSYVFSHFGIEVPRSSSGYSSAGTGVKPEEFRAGDILVFYGYQESRHIGHVGIICEANGMNSTFIHASSGKAMGVTISSLGSKGYTRRYVKCVDVIR
jgi:cell wall-associated NlpC family hydrolase